MCNAHAGLDGEPRSNAGSRPGTSQATGSHRVSRPGTSSGASKLQTATSSGTNIPGGSQFLTKPHDGKDAINRDILQTVRQTFIDADDDGSGKLAPDEFTQAFTGVSCQPANV